MATKAVTATMVAAIWAQVRLPTAAIMVVVQPPPRHPVGSMTMTPTRAVAVAVVAVTVLLCCCRR